MQTVGSLDGGINDLFLSRDGRHLILKTGISELPKNWKQYEDQTIQTAFRRVIPPGASSGLLRYEWIDLSTNQSTPILEAPAPFSSDELLWAPDSRSVLLGGVYLPLDSNDVGRQKERKSAKYVIEIRLPTRKVIEVRAGELIPVHWDQQANVVQFRMRSNQSQAVSERKDVYYQKVQDEWKQVLSSSSGQPKHLPDIVVDQDLNIPPRIVAINGATRQTILDLNPQFAGLAFGRVEPIEWPDGSGETMNGGLYLPPNYDPSHRYPLVIQTHGFDPHAFWIDGPWSTAFAAQPLAGRGIVVLQINDSVESWRNTSVESERIMRAYESAIDFLDQKGIIDPRRVGIVGFSRTCLYVKYTLTHSRRRFAAAVASDGFDGGYFEYVAAGPLAKSEMEAVAGALPFGPELGLWMRKAPGFLLDKVQTPIQLHANAAASLLEQWEWFAGLKRLGKAVDLLYIPADVHILMKPWDRMAAEQASVDWFCFWLKGEENPNPEKATQYVRWRQLRALTRSPSE
ncbi:MAG TPA: hypothetical protein VN577_11655 [Terriglobales bacterium]|nr:hypothetical protein [Terriglobales bacterium]